MKLYILSVLALTLLSVSSCTNTQVGPPNGASDLFPLSLGSQWTYSIYDSVAKRADTVHVVLDATQQSVAGTYAYLWLYEYTTHTDSMYSVISGDTIDFYSPYQFHYLLSGSPQFPSLTFVFPIDSGQTWQTPSYSISVTEGSISVPAGSFPSSLGVYDQPHIGNAAGGTTYWLAPGVGIVQEDIRWTEHIHNTQGNATWQLLSYSIAR